MRYYDIKITHPVTGEPIVPTSLLAASGTQITSISSLLPNAGGSGAQRTNPAALQVELDIPIYPGHVGEIGSYVRIWGLSLADQKFAPSITGANIEIRGGMAQGYPLANPAQQGLLVKGQVYQAFGNWIGTEMTVDIFLMPPVGKDTPQTAGATSATASAGRNFVFNWLPGIPLSQAIAQTLSLALPEMKQNIQIGAWNTTHQQAGYYPTLTQFAQMIQSITASGTGANGSGVVITCDGITVYVRDGSPPTGTPNIKNILFQDLLGQVTYAQPGIVTAKLVMRGDLKANDIVSFPENLVTTTSAALRQFQDKDKTQFPGKYQVLWLHHWGNSRQPDAMSWNTTIWCTPYQGSDSG